MSTPIAVHNLNLWYHAHQTLKDINVQMPARNVTAIIGPSGCGKTTLLRCINRMIDLVPGVRINGSIRIGSQEIFRPGVDITDVRKRVGLIMQKPIALPMSIFDNVAYGPRLYGQGRRQLPETVERSLRTAGLWEEVKDRLRDPASRLSLGQLQRLCLARGLAVEPEVLLFDEPTSALDPISTVKLEQEIMQLKKTYTCVIVTHNIQQAMRIADHVLFVYLGEVVEHGEAHQVFNSPREEATASYIGSGI